MTRVQAKQEAGGIIQHDEPGHRHAASSVCLRQPFSRCCLVPTAVYSKTCQIACHGGNTSAEPAKIMIAGSPRPWTGECNKRVATARGRREHGRGAKKHFKPTATNLCAGTLGEKRRGEVRSHEPRPRCHLSRAIRTVHGGKTRTDMIREVV
jgi:hypothetical protein